MKLDWNLSLDEILTEEHFWKSALAWAVLYCSSLLWDLIGGGYTFSDFVLMVGSVFIFYGMIVHQKRRYEKRARVLNNINLDEDIFQTLEEIEKELPQDVPLYSVLAKRKSSELTWRDFF